MPNQRIKNNSKMGKKCESFLNGISIPALERGEVYHHAAIDLQ